MKNRKRNLRKRVADTSDNEAEETNLAKALEERDERAFKTTGIDSSVLALSGLETSVDDDKENPEKFLQDNYQKNGELPQIAMMREQYIERKLNEQLHPDAVVSETVETPDNGASLPVLAKDDDEQTNWITGMSEVELPIEYKLQNIEETASAKTKVLLEQKYHPTKTERTASSDDLAVQRFCKKMKR